MRNLSRIGGWLASAYALTIAALQLWAAVQEGDAGGFLLSLFFIPLAALPIVVAAGLVGASPTRLSAALFLAVEAGLILSAVLAVVYTVYIPSSSTASVALLVWPLYQLAAVLVAALLACLFGWRMRPDFLREEASITASRRA
jgi:hypothetical protein